jgi:hypothetical protein
MTSGGWSWPLLNTKKWIGGTNLAVSDLNDHEKWQYEGVEVLEIPEVFGIVSNCHLKCSITKVNSSDVISLAIIAPVHLIRHSIRHADVTDVYSSTALHQSSKIASTFQSRTANLYNLLPSCF